jgi:alpha-glucosidase (family GH31 glycosyl hydrolase)
MRDHFQSLLICAILGILAWAGETSAAIQLGGSPVEISVQQISPRTMRIQLLPLDQNGQPRLAPPSSVLAPFESKELLRVRELGDSQEVHIGTSRLVIKHDPLRLSLAVGDGKTLQELVFDAADGSFTFRTDAPVFGLGEGQKQFDRRGARYPMINGQVAPFLATHGGTIPVPLLIGADGWAMFVNGPWGQFDLRDGHGKFVPRQQAVGREPIDLFLIAHQSPAQVLEEMARLVGRAVMPPKWVLGYMQSHRTLAGPAEVMEIARRFREKQLPCDALIYLGTGYCPAGWNTGHGSLEFNPATFDKPQQMIDSLHAEGFKVVLHVNHAPRDLFGSITERSDAPSHINNYWARHRPDFAMGVDGWWPDDGDELPIEARLARLRCYFEGPLADRPDERPWSLDRNGYAGAARFGAWIWSGDVDSRWATLAAHVPVGLNFSVSVSPFWGTDTGGFIPTPDLTGELYVRWFQFSAFNPLFRSHGRTWHLRLPWGWNTGDAGPIETRFTPDAAELHNAQVEPICRKYLDLRYQLLPYNYTLVRQACDSGLPPMRPMWLYWSNDPQAVPLGDQYMWGQDLLIAPVVEKGATTRRLYLPTGKWYDWWTGQVQEGGQWINRAVDLSTLPIYARAGAIIPLDPVRQFTAQQVREPATLQIFPGADGDFTLYDDDGHSLAYQHADDPQAVWLKMHWDDAARTLTISPDPQMKQWRGVRAFNVHAADRRESSKRIEFNGERMVIPLPAT